LDDRLSQEPSAELWAHVARHHALLERLAGAAILPDHPMAVASADALGLG
jgi:hypothetical protein